MTIWMCRLPAHLLCAWNKDWFSRNEADVIKIVTLVYVLNSYIYSIFQSQQFGFYHIMHYQASGFEETIEFFVWQFFDLDIFTWQLYCDQICFRQELPDCFLALFMVLRKLMQKYSLNSLESIISQIYFGCSTGAICSLKLLEQKN